jgi:hypothetical protein
MAAPPKPKPSTRPAKPPGLPADARPFLRFHHSAELRAKTLAVLASVEQAEDPADHRDALAEVVVELTNKGLDGFFMQPLKTAKAGFLLQQSANLGMAGAQQVMGSVIRNIIGRMEGPQLLSVCGSIRGFMA